MSSASGPYPSGAATLHSHADHARSECERPEHVVRVAHVTDGPPSEVAEDLAHRENVGDGLARMGQVRQQVHDRNPVPPRNRER